MVNIRPNILVNHQNINGLNLPIKRCYLTGFLKNLGICHFWGTPRRQIHTDKLKIKKK